ncbi:MAG TPA: N-acetylmuramoyl-L-alanine amidase [Saprospiraceae bacterium]|jgi:N-acetylmuramoyl-L-alanine amidase|nr:N-acetylmuramoyl-L-alanine amidase [Saprospiraceae bacterium]
MPRLMLVLFTLCLCSVTYAGEKNHAVAKVRKGENLEVLLKRYLLTPHHCNIETFCDLNNLKSKNKIIAGKVYKLPLLIIRYNGKNIRSSTGISDLSLAKRVEKLNADLLKAGIRHQHYKDNKKIWVPMAEYDCGNASDSENVAIKIDNNFTDSNKAERNDAPSKTYVPTATELKRKGIKTISAPIMGPAYEEVFVEDLSLKGQVFYILSGHGGPDPGAMYTAGKSDMCEDEYAYDVALRLARNLMQHGATVEMVVQDENDGIRDEMYLDCDNDETTLGKYTIPLSQKKRLRDRAATVNKLYQKYKRKGYKVQKAIEIHVDSRSKETRQDVFFYYNKNSKSSKKLAETVQGVFESKYNEHQKDRGYQGFVEDRGIYMVRTLTPTMVFVELANIRNLADQERLLINSNRQALANWLFEGLRK